VIVDVAGKEDHVVKRKHSSFVYAENVELLLKYERLYPRDPYGPVFGTRQRSRTYLYNVFQRIRVKGRKYKISTTFPRKIEASLDPPRTL